MQRSDELNFDTRLVRRLVRNKEVTQAAYDAHLKALPDISEQATEIVAANGKIKGAARSQR